MKRRLMAISLCFAMVASAAPTGVFATANTEGNADTENKRIEVDGVDYEYDVVLPEGYNAEDTSTKYPVIYLMPDDGEDGNSEVLSDQLDKALAGDTIVDSIVVKPSFDEDGADPYKAVEAIIASVDGEYNTLSAASARAVVGAQVGGYLASIMTYTDGEGKWNGSPKLFGMMASIHGDYVSEDNEWIAKYGNFYDIATNKKTGSGNMSNAVANKFYTFMDAATEEASASADKGANDIISYYIDRGAAYGGFYYAYYGNADSYALDLTIKNGKYDDAFVRQSVNEAVEGIGDKLVQGMVAGSLSLTPQAAYASEKEIKANYDIKVGKLYTDLRGDAANDLKLTISMTDADTGAKVAEDVVKTVSAKESQSINNLESYIALPNKINNVSTNVTLTAEILGKKIVIDSKPLVRIAATGEAPEEQLIDLLGGWHFKALSSISNVGTLPEAADYRAWEEVYPCLGWWDNTLSTVTNMKNYVGYAWYVKDFEIPSTFPTGEYVVPVGFFDETDIVFINGHQIGGYGLDYNTWKFTADCWDTERIYSINSDYLNIGGTNTITVLTYNKSGDGGWYNGHPGLYSAAAYNKLTSKPSVFASAEDTAIVKSAVAAQREALAAKNLDAYANTVDPEFFQSGCTKEMLMDTVSAYVKGDAEVSVKDVNDYVFASGDLYYYQATRTIEKADGTSEEVSVAEYYRIENNVAVLYGEHDRFYTQTIPSAKKAAASGSKNDVENESFLVYLPEGYFDAENADRRYPTAYVFHQINSSSNSYAIDGINRYLDEGIKEGKIKDTILIIPDSTPQSWWTNGWDAMVTEDVLPFVEEHYRTIQDARYRFTVGASMGGSGSYNIGLRNPDLFSGIVSFFGAINMGATPVNVALAASDEYLDYYTQYFICGNRDLYKFGIPAITLDKKLRQANVEHFFEIEEGEHDSSFYLPYLKDAFGYQTDAMSLYSKDDASKAMSVKVDPIVIEDGKVTVNYTVDVKTAVKEFLNTVPASSYTKDENPELTIPVTVSAVQNGKTVFTKTVIIKADDVKSVNDTMEIAVADLDTEKEFTVRVAAGLLNTAVVGEYKNALPAEEEPVVTPVVTPTETPVVTPVVTPTEAPVVTPVVTPTEAPVVTPTAVPTAVPTPAEQAPTVVTTPDTTVEAPAKPALSSVKKASKKLVVKWKKVKKISGYQISYATNKKFAKAKKITVSSKKTTYTLKNLKANKTYYVRIRSYKTVDGKKYFSKYSNVKKVSF